MRGSRRPARALLRATIVFYEAMGRSAVVFSQSAALSRHRMIREGPVRLVFVEGIDADSLAPIAAREHRQE